MLVMHFKKLSLARSSLNASPIEKNTSFGSLRVKSIYKALSVHTRLESVQTFASTALYALYQESVAFPGQMQKSEHIWLFIPVLNALSNSVNVSKMFFISTFAEPNIATFYLASFFSMAYLHWSSKNCPPRLYGTLRAAPMMNQIIAKVRKAPKDQNTWHFTNQPLQGLLANFAQQTAQQPNIHPRMVNPPRSPPASDRYVSIVPCKFEPFW